MALHTGKTRGFQADPFAKKPTSTELYEDYNKLMLLEKDCAQKLRDTDKEALDVLEVTQLWEYLP